MKTNIENKISNLTKELNTMNDLREYIYSKKANDTVTLQVTRGRINKTINITLGKK